MMVWMTIFDPKEYTLKVFVEIFIRSVSRMVGSSGGYLEDIEDSR